jgi:hypothetical protein
MHHDCQLYRTPYSDCGTTSTTYKVPQPTTADSWMKPMPTPTLSSLITVPANWHLDDWPPFSPGDGGSDGFIDPHVIEKMWKEHFEFYYDEYDEFVFPLSIHPQISGKPHVLGMLRRMIEWINGFDGVEWCTFGEMVTRYKEGGIGGFDVLEGLGVKDS